MKVTGNFAGSPCWAQLGTSDPRDAQRFYGGLFGWTAETNPDPAAGGYTIFSLDGSPSAAVSPLMDPNQPVQWLISIATTDVDASTQTARKAGAQVWADPMDVLDSGRWAMLSDPTGAPFSLWQAKEFTGFGVVNEPNAFGWIDMATRDVPGALRFYTEVFGWQTWPDENYPMVGLADVMFGGVLDMATPGSHYAPDAPARWLPFFISADVDATTAKARELGGDVVHGPGDVNGGPRTAVLQDPQGARFGVFKPAGPPPGQGA